MKSIPDIFGSNVFGETAMRKQLPEAVFSSLMETIRNGTELDNEVADAVAAAMKDWAIEKGATHYSHWFQPMTGVTAEKHDSFIAPKGAGIIMEFSGKNLIKGEPDASSFPSGGLRATFEARGYTAWDPTSPAFIKDHILCIPSVFLSYGGEVLDKKTPLLRSMEAIDKQARRVLKCLGEESSRVIATAGAEQEYFLVPKELYAKRKDLVYTGRTLFGAAPPKGQELDDQYFGAIRSCVSSYMEDLNEELWKLGVLAKTQHNEVAPSQHELAPVFENCNMASDHNQLTMEVMKKVAERHGLVCLLHEKPFSGVNGSGKHNNWSLATAEGVNLLESNKGKPHKNLRFLLFLSAVIAAVDRHQDLLRMGIATAANDHRLGANEAPPAVISIFIGDELVSILESISSGKEYTPAARARISSGVSAVPDFKKDTTDRNRTSPFAFTGNKFEFRMPGSSASISGTNFILNTIVADVLEGFADSLENSSDITTDVKGLIKKTFDEHSRIIFNGNNYAPEWLEEAQKRGLLNLQTTADAVPYFKNDKNIELFARHGILTAAEIKSRTEIILESYVKAIRIEALTASSMAQKEIIPAAVDYSNKLVKLAKGKAVLNIGAKAEIALTEEISELMNSFYVAKANLDGAVSALDSLDNAYEKSEFCRDAVLPAMDKLREFGDRLELLLERGALPYPTYGDLLYYL